MSKNKKNIRNIISQELSNVLSESANSLEISDEIIGIDKELLVKLLVYLSSVNRFRFEKSLEKIDFFKGEIEHGYDKDSLIKALNDLTEEEFSLFLNYFLS